MPSDQIGLSLSDLLLHAADEVREESVSRQPVMQFEECELELAVTLTGEGGAGVKFWIVSASSSFFIPVPAAGPLKHRFVCIPIASFVLASMTGAPDSPPAE